jgi:hypothetical protein
LSTSTDPVERYLDELADRLRSLPGSELRRVLGEADDHLRSSVAAFVESGLGPDEAAARAIEQFGTAATVARQVRMQHPAGLAGLVIDAMRKLSLVVVAGLCAIGLSGWISVAIGTIFGKAFVAGDAPGVTYTAERCADFRSFHPEAGSCASAATAHHFDEVVGYRQDLGVLGVLGAVALLVLVRRGVVARWLRTGPLPESTPPIVSAVLFGAFAAGLTGLAVMSMAFGVTNGAGSLLSDGLVAAVAFTFSVWWLSRSVSGDATLRG